MLPVYNTQQGVQLMPQSFTSGNLFQGVEQEMLRKQQMEQPTAAPSVAQKVLGQIANPHWDNIGGTSFGVDSSQGLTYKPPVKAEGGFTL